jgi:tryptophanyl-tRNA synthetase
MLTRAHSYKDAVAKGLDVNMGVFNYPVLMAADILLFDADVVPVGQDQKQHLEMTRDFAQRFNHRYGQVLHLPEPRISEELALVPGTDGEKMSKSKHNVVSVFASDADWKLQVMSIVTGTQSLAEAKDPTVCTVYTLYKLLSAAPEAAAMADRYRAGGYGFGHAKAALIDQLKLVFGPMRELYFDWLKRPDDMRDLLLKGSSDARRLAQHKLEQVQAAVGVIGRPF